MDIIQVVINWIENIQVDQIVEVLIAILIAFVFRIISAKL